MNRTIGRIALIAAAAAICAFLPPVGLAIAGILFVGGAISAMSNGPYDDIAPVCWLFAFGMAAVAGISSSFS